ncbi:RES domain-containing protein [Nocardioides plantarum]|uniref:RES domain-containing protein n=1 Tax=Nocardioides plantarum TaxID=29299 RepID=UPI001B8745C8|nr:RES domain-containing protein [Nocardioides plantarum]
MRLGGTVADPPDPFDAEPVVLDEGTLLYRTHGEGRRVTEFNPGIGAPTRFAFFGDPPVPVLYAAETEEAAVAETLLHDVPLGGGILSFDDYRKRIMGRFAVRRTLRLARLHGLGLRRLEVDNTDVIDVHGPGVYERTVAWAEAAHDAGFDGVEWMSTRCNSDRAQVFFGDRVDADDLAQDVTFARVFGIESGFNWLVDICAPLRVDVMPPT